MKNFLPLLKENYPTKQSVVSEIINLEAISSLPKGTEHFLSDIHGEYELFNHILNNCSGVIREKVSMIFSNRYPAQRLSNLCTLIYYPEEKLSKLESEGGVNEEFFQTTLADLIELSKLLSSKYSRSYVKKAMPVEYASIIDELLRAQAQEDDNRQHFHSTIINSIIHTGSAKEFIVVLCSLIKRLAVDSLHIVGDIFDRGSHADRILDVLMSHHNVDITWGNHDILWMAAAAGNEACIATVLRLNIAHNNLSILENGYGISLRELSLFAQSTYCQNDSMSPLQKAISVIQFKLEGQAILRNSQYQMQDRLLLNKIDKKNQQVEIDGKIFKLKTSDFPTVDEKNPYQLTDDEQKIIKNLKKSFLNSVRLQKHTKFLYEKGSIYLIFNQNLIYHGCIPISDSGELLEVSIDGEKYKGKSLMDICDKKARNPQQDLDFMWYLWCGKNSPLAGRSYKTFERTYIEDKSTWVEETNPYYKFYDDQDFCKMLLSHFGLTTDISHIINGHTPVIVSKGESPIKANGKLLVIDGGFCKAYHKTTGIAGYTLVSNSHGLKIKAHRPFENIDKVLNDNCDVNFISTSIELFPTRQHICHTDKGQQMQTKLHYLRLLLQDFCR